MTGPQKEDDEELKPSLAIPPLYVLRGRQRCSACGWLTSVYALSCAAFRDGKRHATMEKFHILNFIGSIPKPILKMLEAKCHGYYTDRMDASNAPYLMNHCRCETRI